MEEPIKINFGEDSDEGQVKKMCAYLNQHYLVSVTKYYDIASDGYETLRAISVVLRERQSPQ